jgi:hypothetical protein
VHDRMRPNSSVSLVQRCATSKLAFVPWQFAPCSAGYLRLYTMHILIRSINFVYLLRAGTVPEASMEA